MGFDKNEIAEQIQEIKDELSEGLFRNANLILWTRKIQDLVEQMCDLEKSLFLEASDPRNKQDFLCEMKAFQKIIRSLEGLVPKVKA